MTYQTEAPDHRHASHGYDYEDRDRNDRIEDTVKSNKLPLALIGLGVGWMLLSSARETETWQDYERRARIEGRARSAGLRRRAGNTLHNIRESADHLRRQAGETYEEYRHRAEGRYDEMKHRAEGRYAEMRHRAEGAYDRARGRFRGSGESHDPTAAGYDRVADYDSRRDEAFYGQGAGASGGDYGETARHRYEEVTDRARGLGRDASRRARQYNRSFWDMVDEHPLAAGMMGLALGAALGASLPPTETEDEWIGEYRDRAMDQAWARGRETAERAADTAKEAAKAGTDAARDTAGKRAEEHGLKGENKTGTKTGEA